MIKFKVVALLILFGVSLVIATGIDTTTSAVVAVENGDGQRDDTVSVEVSGESFIDPNVEEFIPSHEWQVVKKGQAVPAGMDIRFNMKTGVSEAKLPDGRNLENTKEGTKQPVIRTSDSVSSDRADAMKTAIEDAMRELKEEKEDSSSKFEYWSHDGREGMMNTEKKTFSINEIKQALKRFKASRDDVQDEKVAKDSKKQKFRTIGEIKDELSGLKLDMKTDIEILQTLKEAYENPETDSESKIALLEDMEYYLHQIDNAVDFLKIGGLMLVIKDLNHTNRGVRTHASLVLGSACQSNRQVQDAAVESRALGQLIRLLSLEGTFQPASQSEVSNTKSRLLYALSAILRHNPDAQNLFLQSGGLNALGNIFMEAGMEKLKVKAVTLVNDVLVEQKETLGESSQNSKSQHQRIDLERSLINHGWCDHLTPLLSISGHDPREKVLVAMSTLAEPCHQAFSVHLDTLMSLKSEYEQLSDEEKQNDADDDNEYYNSMYLMLKDLIRSIHIAVDKDEL